MLLLTELSSRRRPRPARTLRLAHADWPPRRSAPRCCSSPSSARASPRSGSRPTTSACSCWRTRSPPPARSSRSSWRSARSRAPTSTRSSPSPTGRSAAISTPRRPAVYIAAQVAGACLGADRRQPDVRAPRRRRCRPTTRSSAGALAGRGRRHVRAAARDPRRASARGRGTAVAVRGRRLHRGGLLVHVVDQLRQPRRHHRPHAHPTRSPASRPSSVPAVRRRPARRRRSSRSVLIRFLYPAPDGRRPRRPARPTTDTTMTRDAPSRPCCSSACTTPGAPRWRSGGSTTSPATGPSPGPAAPNPATEVNPAAVAAMAEVGIDITGELPKRWTDEIVRAADVVVTMGCGDACPFFPASATRTGSSTTPPARASTPSARSATRSSAGSRRCSPTSASPRGDSSVQVATIVAASAIRWSFDHGGPNVARGP